jgi:Uma2 family endonuclease
MSARYSAIDAASRTLVEGEHLDQPTFHARYLAMPSGSRAELIAGVVHLPNPLGRAHGSAQVPAMVWLSYYAEATAGVEVVGTATTVLGWKSEPQTDVILRVLPECGGRTRNDGGFIHGAPELIIEVAKATRYVDLGPKLIDYEQAGVLEYVVRALDPDEVLWFQQDQGSLALIPPDADGIYRSKAFPGLWLDPRALLQGHTRQLRSVLDLGLSTHQHGEFAARLAAARSEPRDADLRFW